MIGRAAAALAVVVMLASCAARLWLGPIVIEEYADVRVRIYRAGLQCRIEVLAATESIQTPITRCTTMPRQTRTHEALP